MKKLLTTIKGVGRRFARDEQGSVIVYAAVTLTLLLTLLGIVLDGGYQVLAREHSQSSSDAAAVAAMENIFKNQFVTSETNAVNAAVTLAQANTAVLNTVATTNPSTGVWQVTSTTVPTVPTVPFTMTLNFYSDLTQTTLTSDATQVAMVSADVATSWKPLFLGAFIPGAGDVRVHTSGHAAFAKTTAYDVYAMASSGNGFTETGSGRLTVTGGGLAVNSSSTNASCLSGTSNVTGTTIGVVGGTSSSGCIQGYTPSTHAISPVPDPFSRISAPTDPSIAQIISLPTNTSVATATPGPYQGIAMHNAQKLTLVGPGVFIFTGPVSLIGNSQLLSTGGATVYFTCQSTGPSPTAVACPPGQTIGGLSVANGSTVALAAQTSGPYQGLAIMYDRHLAAPLAIAGGAGDALTGSIYAWAAPIVITNGGVGTAIDSRIVANTISITGGASLSVSFTQSNNYTPFGAPGLVP